MCSNPWFKIDSKTKQKLTIPCGNCLSCRLDSQLLWTARCHSEEVKGRNAFVTFTYDDLHIKYNDNALLPTLCREDLHKYIDNIRHKINKMPVLPFRLS